MIKAVIFDIDGTLIDSVDAHAESWVRTFKEFGKEISFEAAGKLVGMGSDQFLSDYFSTEEVEKKKKEIDEYRSELVKKEYMAKIKPFPKVRDLFLKLKKDNIKIALASSATKEEVEKYEEIAGIKDLVEKKTSTDDAEKSKPEPDIFLAAYDKLGKIDKQDIVVIGDTPYDAVAAKKAELKIIGVLTGGWAKKKLVKSGCSEVFEDIAAIYEKHYENAFKKSK
ncbi:MAG TPA: HAD family hydrolase [Pyrinomonadaceae bacterium]|nr:HAD family hydrolase [Pyrinomonadaceae bacterium]